MYIWALTLPEPKLGKCYSSVKFYNIRILCFVHMHLNIYINIQKCNLTLAMSPLCNSILSFAPAQLSTLHNCNKPCGWFKFHGSIISHGLLEMVRFHIQWIHDLHVLGFYNVAMFHSPSSKTFQDMNYYPVWYLFQSIRTGGQTDRQTDRKWRIWAHRAKCTGWLKNGVQLRQGYPNCNYRDDEPPLWVQNDSRQLTQSPWNRRVY